MEGPYRDGPASGETKSHLCRLRILGYFGGTTCCCTCCMPRRKGGEEGSYLRFIDLCITQLWARE